MMLDIFADCIRFSDQLNALSSAGAPGGSAFFSGLSNERLLLIDASGARAIAVLIRSDSGDILTLDSERELPTEPPETPANIGGTLFPAIDALLKDAKTAPADLTGIIVNRGPGSWTGLRVGIAAAKTLALVLNIPVQAYSNLDALALEGAVQSQTGNPAIETESAEMRIAALLDGRSAGLFGAIVRYNKQTQPVLERVTDEMSASADEWKDWLTLAQSGASDSKLLIVTDSAEKAADVIPGDSPVTNWRILPAAHASLPATIVCALSDWKYRPELRLAGSAVHSLAPAYLRAAHFKKIRQ